VEVEDDASRGHHNKYARTCTEPTAMQDAG